MQNFIIANMSLIYFFYGLAFFTLGLSLAIQSRKDSEFVLSKSLWFLAVFGLIHAWAEWAKIYMPMEMRAGDMSGYNVFHIAEAMVVATSFLFLFLFGVNLLVDSIKKYYPIKYLPLILAGIWFIKFVGWDLAVAGVENCGYWAIYSTTAARYILAFPGALVTGIAFFIQAGLFKGFNLKSAARYCQLGGICFLLYGFFSGLVVLPVGFWPGNFLNTETFFNFIGLPVQIFRALLGLVIAFIIIKLINIFDEEQNQRLAQVMHQSIVVQERERLGRDLHDGIMQSIYSVGLVLETGKLMLQQGETEALAAQLDDSQDKLRKTMVLLRNYIGNILQVHQEEQGLKDLLETLGQEFKGLSMLHLKIKNNLENDIILTPRQASNIDHILKEALFNIVKHAHASQVEIQVSPVHNGNRQNINVLIIDDGKGFNLSSAENTDLAEHHGLTNMKFRAQRLQGSLEVISAPKMGTRISLTFPAGGQFGKAAN
ncbi:MAG: hypothetical protein CVU89_10930 [Firmicutes bacterium HGW-Firmicutes-14]|nr:MAG: hypothetical protein CVU89_10930 [Firmicutes bacterium HGW-Firmicutes-14]